MAHPTKQAAITELTDRFRDSSAVVLTEYRGLTVAQLTQLRRSLGEHSTYAVVKNTLTAIAAGNAGVTAFEGHLSGPSAIAFVTGDPVEAAKRLRDFARANPALVIKAGVLDGKPLTAGEISRIADLESRELLLAKLAGAMSASLSQAVHLFAAPLSQTARLVEALRVKREAEGPTAPATPRDALSDTAESATDVQDTVPDPLLGDTMQDPLQDDTVQDPLQDDTVQDSVEDNPVPADSPAPAADTQDTAASADSPEPVTVTQDSSDTPDTPPTPATHDSQDAAAGGDQR